MASKPIKRNVNIQPLSRQHHHGLLCSWKIRQGLKKGVETARIIAYLDYFWQSDLEAHFLNEEQLLFSQVSHKLVTQANEEHAQIRELLNALLHGSIANPSEALAQFADLLDNHIRFEERVLFPYFEETLSEEVLIKIGRQLQEEESTCTSVEFADVFWEK